MGEYNNETKMTYALSVSSKRHRAGVDERLIRISDRAIEITLIDFGHGRDSGKRLPSRQNELYRDEKSHCDGYINQSYHQTGRALDFYAFIDGKSSWEREHLAMVACAFLQAASELKIKIKWGGLWRSKSHQFYGWDMPHIQLDEV
jgi:peptidoglycan L-alanyl-D-glutamate endopeptidase CwlK